jgi:hypothetical protein
MALRQPLCEYADWRARPLTHESAERCADAVRNRRGIVRVVALVLLSVVVTFCAGRGRLKSTASDPGLVPIEQLWVEPRDLETRNLIDGVGGSSLAPNKSTPYEVIAEDDSGFSPGYTVRDAEGTQWNVKLGIEAQPEVVASRILWAIGYHQPAVYLLPTWELSGAQSQTQPVARFRRESVDERVVGNWSWYENPFVTTQPFKGLLVANLILNNWDWKTSNNKIYEIKANDGASRRVYVVRDLGASLGKTTFPRLLSATPLRGLGQGTRNDIKGFEEQGFVRKIEGQRVTFDYHGIYEPLVGALTVNDVIWTCRLMARISDRQWQDAFRAAGYQEAEQRRYITKLKSKISEGLALAG